jgi:aarF domain-containing kinase
MYSKVSYSQSHRHLVFWYSFSTAAITGRPTGSFTGGKKSRSGRLAALQQTAAMLDMGNVGEADMEKLRNMVMTNGDLMVTMFAILRRLDSKVLMLLKLNELTRALDNALSTTHPPVSLHPKNPPTN